MKSFLVRGKRPIIKWGMLPDGIFYEGEVPEGFKLAVCPTKGFVIVDVDKHGDKNGFKNLPNEIKKELKKSLTYQTKNGGRHYWIKYTGKEYLGNKASSLGIDLRTHKGYVVWYPKRDVRDSIKEVKDSSPELNIWLESIFGYKVKY